MCVEVDYVVGYFFEAEDGIRYLVRSRGLGDVYKRQIFISPINPKTPIGLFAFRY